MSLPSSFFPKLASASTTTMQQSSSVSKTSSSEYQQKKPPGVTDMEVSKLCNKVEHAFEHLNDPATEEYLFGNNGEKFNFTFDGLINNKVLEGFVNDYEITRHLRHEELTDDGDSGSNLSSDEDSIFVERKRRSKGRIGKNRRVPSEKAKKQLQEFQDASNMKKAESSNNANSKLLRELGSILAGIQIYDDSESDSCQLRRLHVV